MLVWIIVACAVIVIFLLYKCLKALTSINDILWQEYTLPRLKHTEKGYED